MRTAILISIFLLLGCVSKASEPPVKRSIEETRFDAAWQSAVDWAGCIDGKAESYRFIYSQDAYSPALDDLLASFGSVSALDGEYRWVIPPAKELVCNSNKIALIPFPSQPDKLGVFNNFALVGFSKVRIVFRVHDQKVPIKMYRHGSDIDVAKWGIGLVPMAIEFVDDSGRRMFQLFIEETNRQD